MTGRGQCGLTPGGGAARKQGSSESLAPTDDDEDDDDDGDAGLSKDRGGSEPRREGLAVPAPPGHWLGQVSWLALLAPSYPHSALLSIPPPAGHRAGTYHTGPKVTTPCKATGFHS